MKGKLLFYPYEMKRSNDYFRFITYGFVHSDLNHLLLNMLSLYLFGKGVEFYLVNFFGQQQGLLLYVFLYFSGLVLSTLPDYYRHQDNPGYTALGASGAVSAIVFAYIFLRPWDIVFWFIPAVLYGILYLIYSAYMDRYGRDNIGHNTHFWGSLYGLMFIFSVLKLMRPGELSYIFQAYMHIPYFQ
jgi:membrane associated rhomboid family serine protease